MVEDASFQSSLGTTRIRVGDDRSIFSTTSVVVKKDIVDGGFFALDNLIEGRYLTIRRAT